jgi:predicted TIM-barrel fold metal-dependent hydrolase
MAKKPLIALEEHFFGPDPLVPASVVALYSQQFAFVPNVHAKLLDIGAQRLADMRRAGVSLQVVAHAPGMSGSEAAQAAALNDFLAQRLRRPDDNDNNPAAAAAAPHARFFRGLAVLPMASPRRAADELRRCVRELGLVGAMVDNHVERVDGDGDGGDDDDDDAAATRGGVRGERVFYDREAFACVFEAAQELDVPIYLHPMFPTASLAQTYEGNYIDGAALSMASSGWGWHSECGLHVLRLFAAGVFDRFPKLKIIVGHFGEMLPFMVDRIAQLSVRWGKRDRDFSTVWKENIWITTSGVWSIDPMAMIKRNTPVDKTMFSIDTPFAKAEDGKKFWEELQASNMYSSEEMDDIGWKNAARLFKLDEEELVKAAQEL